MPEVGEALRAARAERGVELADAERATKIRARYLQAMEEERWEVLPGRAAARGFLATYAHFLALDQDALVSEYTRQAGRTGEIDHVPSEMLPKPGTLPGRSRWPGAVVAVGFLAIVVAGIVALSVAGESDDDSGAPVREAASEAPGAGGGGSGGGSGAAGGGSQAKEKKQGSKGKSGSGSSQSKGTSGASTVKLQATGDVWVCLLSGRGRPLVEGETLTTDERRGPFERRAFTAAFGNGSVDLTVDGKAVDVPAASDPLGYRIGADGARLLDDSKRPDCQ